MVCNGSMFNRICTLQWLISQWIVKLMVPIGKDTANHQLGPYFALTTSSNLCFLTESATRCCASRLCLRIETATSPIDTPFTRKSLLFYSLHHNLGTFPQFSMSTVPVVAYKKSQAFAIRIQHPVLSSGHVSSIRSNVVGSDVTPRKWCWFVNESRWDSFLQPARGNLREFWQPMELVPVSLGFVEQTLMLSISCE